jgi:hypothetical protein
MMSEDDNLALNTEFVEGIDKATDIGDIGHRHGALISHLIKRPNACSGSTGQENGCICF